MPFLIFAIFALLPLLVFAQNPANQTTAREAYLAARATFDKDQTNADAAWKLGRAAFDLTEIIPDKTERNQFAEAGVEACHKAVALKNDSAAAHYYLALNLGETARAKKLAAFRILRDMEQELLSAAQLDPSFDYGGPDRSLGMLYFDAPSIPPGIGNKNKARIHLEKAVRISSDYPENRICLAEALAKWGEVKSLEHELSALDSLMPSAKAKFGLPQWEATWKDWDSRIAKLRSIEDHLAANPRATPAERGARHR